VLLVFCENVPKIALSFVISRSKLAIFCGTNFELYSCNYFGTEGVIFVNISSQIKSTTLHSENETPLCGQSSKKN